MTSAQISSGAHSRIGASSMHRWAACPGSVKLSEGIPSKSSKYAEEGTRAHDLAAKMLEGKTLVLDSIDAEMMDAIKIYVDEVQSAAKAGGGKFLVEQKFDLSKIHPGLFGTADAIVFNEAKSLLQVYDYKHGAGIAVDVEENEQLMYYGLGALLSTGFKAKDVELIIVQPRCEHPEGRIRRWLFDSFLLLDFAADLKMYAEATEKPNAPLHPGEHCRFCPAAGICPSIHTKALTLAKEEFSPVLSYDPEKLGKVLEWLPALENWIKNVREFAYGEAEHGRCPPGWKLVEKRATRKWRDPKTAAELATKVAPGVPVTEFFTEPEFKSVAQIEKIMGKKFFEQNMDGQTVAESSGLTLVHESDKRPVAKADAKSQFTKIAEPEDLFS